MTRPVLILLLALSCNTREDNSIRTPNLVVNLDADTPLCRGQLLDFDRDVQRITETMGFPPAGPLKLWYGRDAVERRCPDGLLGCASDWGKDTSITIWNPWTFGHEAVHGLRQRRNLYGPASIEEGLATALNGREGVIRRYTFQAEKFGGPAELWPLDRDDFERRDPPYISSGSVIVWMLETYGVDPVMAFVNDDIFLQEYSFDAVTESLQTHLGVTLEDMDAQWWTEAPVDFNVGQSCIFDLTDDLTDDLDSELLWNGRLDCDEGDDTLGANVRNGEWTSSSRPRCFRIADPQNVRISVQADVGSATITSVQPCPVRPWIWFESVAAGDSKELALDACTWKVVLNAPADAPTDWEVTLKVIEP